MGKATIITIKHFLGVDAVRASWKATFILSWHRETTQLDTDLLLKDLVFDNLFCKLEIRKIPEFSHTVAAQVAALVCFKVT